MRLSLHPGVWIGTVGLWIMGGIAVTQSALPTQIATYQLGEIAIVLGVLLFIWGIKWDGEHWWALTWRKITKRRDLPVVYVSHNRERLPDSGPPEPFRVYVIHQTGDADIFWGYSERRGAIHWLETDYKPDCERVEVTNHSAGTLLNVGLEIRLQPVMSALLNAQPPVQKDMTVEFEQVSPGERGLIFIVNDTSFVVDAQVIAGAGTPIGKERGPLQLHMPSFNRLVFYPHPRFERQL